jgi:hypothetical protein
MHEAPCPPELQKYWDNTSPKSYLLLFPIFKSYCIPVSIIRNGEGKAFGFSEPQTCIILSSFQFFAASFLASAALAVALPSSLSSLDSLSLPTSDSVEIASRSIGGNVTVKATARFDNSNVQDGIGNGTDAYTLYLGNGTTLAGWPSKDSWVSFEDMYVFCLEVSGTKTYDN